MTDGTSRPMVFGDIHELLRKVNGESEPAYMWQSDKQGEEVKPETHEMVSEEQKSSDKEEPSSAERPKPDNDQTPSSDSNPEEKPRKKKTKPPPSKSASQKEAPITDNGAEKPKSRKSAFISKEDIQSQIESFSYTVEKGHRHYVFLPDEVFATLETVYGSNRLSAVFTALARAFIDANKEELRRLIAHRTNLLQ
jgi:DNA mismatch repair ATPase MutL